MKIDFHAHVLPGMDHGCKDLEMSLRQLESAAGAGVDMVIATSHFYPHVHTAEEFVARRTEAMKLLCKGMKGNPDYPRVLLGAEVLICNKLDKMPGIDKLCVTGTNVILLEFPFDGKWERELVDTAVRIHQREGFQVVLAHADRYDFDAVAELVDAGIRLQLNADSICSIKKYGLCKKYLKTDRVVALGSDIHGMSTGYKNFDRAVRKLGGSAEIIFDRTQEIMKDCFSYL